MGELKKKKKAVLCISLREKMSFVSMGKKAQIMIVVSFPCSFEELLLPKLMWFCRAEPQCPLGR